MKVVTTGHTVIISDRESVISDFVEKITNQYTGFKGYNLILDISKHKELPLETIKQFLPLAKEHKKAKKSLVVVTNAIDFNAVPKTITVVPTLLEAHDIIEMEEIERDLGF